MDDQVLIGDAWVSLESAVAWIDATDLTAAAMSGYKCSECFRTFRQALHSHSTDELGWIELSAACLKLTDHAMAVGAPADADVSLFYLISALVRRLKANEQVPLLSPTFAARRFLGAVSSLDLAAAQRVAGWWRSDPSRAEVIERLAEVREARKVKNMLTPLGPIADLVAKPFAAELRAWLRLLPDLP